VTMYSAPISRPSSTSHLASVHLARSFPGGSSSWIFSLVMMVKCLIGKTLLAVRLTLSVRKYASSSVTPALFTSSSTATFLPPAAKANCQKQVNVLNSTSSRTTFDMRLG